MRGNSQDTVAKKEHRDLVKKGKTDGERNRENEGIKKKCGDTKVETKAIPKRKKSERSNSETEIKPKKMTIKEHLTSSTRVEESQERNSSVRLSKVRPQDKGSKPTKDLRRPTTLRLSQPQTQVSCVDSVRSVEKQLKEMDLGKDTEGMGVDEAELRGNVNVEKYMVDEGDSMIDDKQIEAKLMECPVEDQRLEKCEEMEEGDETDGKCTIREATKVADHVIHPSDSIQDDGDEDLRKDGTLFEAEEDSEDCKLYRDVEGSYMCPRDASVDRPSYLAVADVSEGDGVGDDVVENVINSKTEDGSAVDDSQVMKDESAMDDSHVMKDEFDLDDSHVMKDESAVDESHVMKDETVIDDSHVMKDETVTAESHVMKDETVTDDSHVMKDETVIDDSHAMKDETVIDDNHVMKDESAMDDNHVMKDESAMDDSHVMKDESAMDGSRSMKGECAVNEVHSIKDEEGIITEELPVDGDPTLDGIKAENKNSEEITRNIERLAEEFMMNEELGLIAVVVSEARDKNENPCVEEECKMEEGLIVRRELEALPVLPEVNGNDNSYLEGETNQAMKVNSDKKQKKKEEEEVTRVNERRIKRKMDTEKTRGGTKKTARLFVDKGNCCLFN